MPGRPLALLLAAGRGSRFERSGGLGPKLLAEVEGVPVVLRAVDAALDAAIGPVVLVEGATPLADVVAARPVRVVRNERWSEGIATSLQAGLAAAAEGGHGAVVVGLADQPYVVPTAWRAVAEGGEVAPQPIAVATYGGRRGNPVRLAATIWDLLPTTGDEGARALMQERPDLVAEIACDGDPHDIDTVEDLDRWS